MGDKITVACKLPVGLHLGDKYGDIILYGFRHKAHARHGFGITHGVDKEAFERWCKDVAGPDVPTDQKHPAVVKKLIFAFDKAEMVDAAAKEMTAEKTGFEGLDPDKPMTGVDPTDTQKTENTKRAKGA